MTTKSWSILKVAMVIFLAVFAVYFSTWHGTFEGYESETAEAARMLMSGDYQIKRAGLGAVMLYMPFVALFKLFGIVSSSALSIVAIFYSALLSVILFFIAREYTTTRVSAIFAGAVALGSMVWPYANAGMEYQLTLGLALLFLLLKKHANGGVNGWLIGTALIFIILTKSYGAIFAIPAALFIASSQHDSQQRLKTILFYVVIPTVLSVVLLFALNKFFLHSFAGFYKASQEFQIIHWWEGWYGLFFSFGKSIFIFNPLLVLAACAYARFWRTHRSDFLFIMSALLLVLLINAPFMYWSDETWGPRKLLPLIPLLHVPLIFILDSARAIRSRIVWLLIGLVFAGAMYVQLLGASYYYGKYLAILRAGDMDSLATMRHIPELSHMVIYHKLFMSYLGGAHAIDYTEMSWFRWTVKQKDVQFETVGVDLRPYHKPDVFWLRKY